jgi:hypothetical protein
MGIVRIQPRVRRGKQFHRQSASFISLRSWIPTRPRLLEHYPTANVHDLSADVCHYYSHVNYRRVR